MTSYLEKKNNLLKALIRYYAIHCSQQIIFIDKSILYNINNHEFINEQ